MTIRSHSFARAMIGVVLIIEMEAMHVMILHKFHNATATRIPDRLRQIIISSGTQFSENAVRLEREPIFAQWRWNCGSYQQWHTAFLLLMEIFMYPNRREANRIWAICDYAFEPDMSLGRAQKARSIMAAIRDRAAAYRNLRKMREPVSMQNRLATRLPARGKIRGPDLIVPKDEVSTTAQSSLFQYTDHGLAMNPTAPEQAPKDNNATHAAASAQRVDGRPLSSGRNLAASPSGQRLLQSTEHLCILYIHQSLLFCLPAPWSYHLHDQGHFLNA